MGQSGVLRYFVSEEILTFVLEEVLDAGEIVVRGERVEAESNH